MRRRTAARAHTTAASPSGTSNWAESLFLRLLVLVVGVLVILVGAIGLAAPDVLLSPGRWVTTPGGLLRDRGPENRNRRGLRARGASIAGTVDAARDWHLRDHCGTDDALV